MTQTTIIDGRLLTPARTLEPGVVLIEGEKIVSVEAQARVLPPGASIIDAAGCIVSPGYVDIHVHGGAGHDTMDASHEALAGMSGFFAEHGVTGFLPTTVTAGREASLAAVRAVADYQARPGMGAQALGVHLEGPYISARRAGAQNPRHVRPPDPAEYVRLFERGNIKLISVAPEIPGVQALTEYAVGRGAAVAMGHSLATYEQAMEAVRWGVTQSTHTYNAMQGMHHRKPGTTGAALTCDSIYAQVIVDLIHVHPAMVDLLLRAKGVSRTVLITDAMRAAGMPDGVYELGGQRVTVIGGQARLPSGNLAGSTLTMDAAVRNLIDAAHLGLADALWTATFTPAESVGMGHRKGKLMPGYDADIILLDRDLNVKLTMVGGRVVYRA